MEMEFVTLILIAVLCVCLFFICRQLNCWYWKINERVDLMKQMLDNQEEIIDLLQEKKPNKVSSKSNQKTIADVDKTPLYEEVEDAISYEVGEKVCTVIEKYGLPAGTIVRIDKVLPEGVLCSSGMKTIGIYSYEEIRKKDAQ